jgi:hypothetical protein
MNCPTLSPVTNALLTYDFDIDAGDGHFIAAATHDKAKPRTSKSTKSDQPGTLDPSTTNRVAIIKYATRHLYTLDLRSHGKNHLTVADQIEPKKEHEMRALKRQTTATFGKEGPAHSNRVRGFYS